MTPLYDVISAQPSVDAGEVRPNQFKLAMAVGNTRHYRVNTIGARHFFETARRAGVGDQIIASIFNELSESASNVVKDTLVQLPKEFPKAVARSIQSGIERRLRLIQTP